ncbi:MAG: GNAT family N-acetyltransferase, partial [Nitrosospira sp.]|nr:GNAT family N-acetyltransferase [Nitrosospira sp.]
MQFNPPEPLTALHRLDDFECGEASLDDWIKRRALANQLSGASRTFVVTDEEGNVRGYYAMAVGAVSHRLPTSGVRRNMPDPIHVMILARLAVD